VIQIGIVLACESPVRRWLERSRPWTATVLINGMIMTIFLWHLTASTITIGLALQFGNFGLQIQPGSGVWWATRPIWLGIYSLLLTGFVLVFGIFERGGRGGPPAAAWRQIIGAILMCGGLSFLALDGVGGTGWLGLRWWVVLLPVVGAALASVNPLPRTNAKAVT